MRRPVDVCHGPDSRSGAFWREHRFGLLLFGLIQHLFIAATLTDLSLYARVIWPLNMVVLGVSTFGVFADASRRWRQARVITTCVVSALPVYAVFTPPSPEFMTFLSACYLGFFVGLFWQVMRFLLRPGPVDREILPATGCGYLLLLEMGVFVLQWLHYSLDGAFVGIDAADFTRTYLDLVYFAAVVLTSIGFGDIAPTHHITKLAVAFFGVVGHLYSAIVIGVLVGKFTASAGDRAASSAPPSDPFEG